MKRWHMSVPGLHGRVLTSTSEPKMSRRPVHFDSAQIRDRLARLTDAYLDGAIEKVLLNERREAYSLRKLE